MLTTYNINDIRFLNPCEDPLQYVSSEWTGTVLDILDLPNLSFKHKCWLMELLLSNRAQRLIAIDSIEAIGTRAKTADIRITSALEAEKAYLIGYGSYEAVLASRESVSGAALSAYAKANDYAKCLMSYYTLELTDPLFYEYWHMIRYVDTRSESAKLTAFRQIINVVGD